MSMLISIVDQLAAASRVAMREADQRATENRIKAERQAEIRAKQWASRKAGNGITEELVKRLPKTKETAVSLGQIKKLMADTETRDSNISSTVSILVKQKRVLRTGECREYRYYLAEGKS